MSSIRFKVAWLQAWEFWEVWETCAHKVVPTDLAPEEGEHSARIAKRVSRWRCRCGALPVGRHEPRTPTSGELPVSLLPRLGLDASLVLVRELALET